MNLKPQMEMINVNQFYDIFISRQLEISATLSLLLLIHFLRLTQLDIYWRQYVGSTLSLERPSLVIRKEIIELYTLTSQITLLNLIQ